MRVGRDVVEQDQRLGAARDHVVDAVRGHVGAAVPQRAALARDDRLRADRVGGGGEQAAVVERMEAREGAEAGRAGRLHGRAQALDDGVRPSRARRRRPRRSRPPRSRASVVASADVSSRSRRRGLPPPPPPTKIFHKTHLPPLHPKYPRRTALRASSGRPCGPPGTKRTTLADLDVAADRTTPTRRRRAHSPSGRVVRQRRWSSPAGARPRGASSSSSQSRGGCSSSR